MFHLALQDQETVVVEIDAALPKERRHVRRIARLVVDEVFAGIVLVRHTADHNARLGNHLIATPSGNDEASTARRQCR